MHKRFASMFLVVLLTAPVYAAKRGTAAHDRSGLPVASMPEDSFPQVAKNQTRARVPLVQTNEIQDLDPEGSISGGATGCVKNQICNAFKKKCEAETSTGGGCNKNGCVDCVP